VLLPLLPPLSDVVNGLVSADCFFGEADGVFFVASCFFVIDVGSDLVLALFSPGIFTVESVKVIFIADRLAGVSLLSESPVT
jgi:hypothetical protein